MLQINIDPTQSLQGNITRSIGAFIVNKILKAKLFPGHCISFHTTMCISTRLLNEPLNILLIIGMVYQLCRSLTHNVQLSFSVLKLHVDDALINIKAY